MIFTTENIKHIVGVVIAALLLTVAYYKWIFTYWKRKGVACPAPSIPFGNAAKFFLRKNTMGELVRDFYRDFKSRGLKYCGVYFLWKRVFLVIDIDLIKRVLTTDFQHFTDHGIYINEKKEPLTGHLFGLKGLKWKNLRSKLTPTYSSGKMKMMFHIVVDCTHGLLNVTEQVIERSDVLNIKDVAERYTSDVIGSCAFGLDCSSLKNSDSEFRRYGKRALKFDKLRALVRFLALFFPRVLDLLSLNLLPRNVTHFFMNVVKQTVEYREKNNIVRNDFMHLLIQLKNNTSIQDGESTNKCNINWEKSNDVGKTLTLDELAAQAFVFFVAGFETSSATLTFCFYELATNTDIQDKLRKEINNVLPKHKGGLTYEAIMDMTYMDKCIQETLRKYPSLLVLMRKCRRTYHIPNTDVVIEKGTRVFIPVLAVHHDPEYYPDPEKFDPERFSPENKANRHSFSWLPFGAGPRSCIGLRFAMLQIKIALVVLLKHYEFTLSSKTPTPIAFDSSSSILTTKSDVWLDVKKIIN